MLNQTIMTQIKFALCVLAFWNASAHAQLASLPSNLSSEDTSGVNYFLDTTYENKRVHIVQINLSHPQVRLRASSAQERGMTPTEFSAKTAAVAVINGDFFDGNLNPVGLAAGDGAKWPQSADTESWSFLACDDKNNCIIDDYQRVTAWKREWTNVVGGWQILLDPNFEWTRADDKACGEFCTTEHPRTALGLSADRKTMWWVMVEGRQRNLSGLSLADTTRIFKKLGARWALNLDGGGSSGLLMNGRRMNLRPTNEPLERRVANCLAVVRPPQ